MELHALLEREFEAVQVEVGVRGRCVAPSVPHVDPLVGIHDKEIHGIVPVTVEQRHIDVIHARNAHAHVLTQLLSQRGVFR